MRIRIKKSARSARIHTDGRQPTGRGLENDPAAASRAKKAAPPTSGGGNTAAAIERVDIADLQPWGKNARVHSPKQVRQLARAIEELGFINPVLIDADNRILAGHGRVAAAKLLGLRSVPCLRVENIDARTKRAYVLADNKLALNASWDEQVLAEEARRPHQHGHRVRHRTYRVFDIGNRRADRGHASRGGGRSR